jgi:hypothetical protein
MAAEQKNIVIVSETAEAIVPDVVLSDEFWHPTLATLPAHKFIGLVNATTEAFQRFHDYSLENRLPIDSEASQQHVRLLHAGLEMLSVEYTGKKDGERALFTAIIEFERSMGRSGTYSRKVSKTTKTAFRDYLQRKLIGPPHEFVPIST